MTLTSANDIPRLLDELRERGFFGEVSMRLRNGRISLVTINETFNLDKQTEGETSRHERPRHSR